MFGKENYVPMKVVLTKLEKLLKRRSSVERFHFKVGISKIMDDLDLSEPTVPEPKPLAKVDFDAIMRDEEYRNECNRQRDLLGMVKFV